MYLNEEQKEVAKLHFEGWIARKIDFVMAQGLIKVYDKGRYEEAKKEVVEEISDYIFNEEA